MLTPDNRVIMISGANRGIGLATARMLSAAGYKLSLGVRDPASIDAADFSSAVSVFKWDATDPATSNIWARDTLEQFGQIDGLVMNAGILLTANLEDDSDDAYNAMWQVNFMGPLRLIRASMPALRKSEHGRVVNLVSLSGKRLMSGAQLGYAATKFASMSLTHAIRQEGWDDNVRATSVCPGLVDTKMIEGFQIPEGQFKIDPETVAATVAYALSLPNKAVVAEILLNSRLEPMF